MTENKMDREQVFCQSCGMPMTEAQQFGTEADGSRNEDYCCYCYDKGAFVQDCTMEEMIAVCLKLNDEHGMMGTRAEAKAAMEQWFPTLKRWKEQHGLPGNTPVLAEIPQRSFLMVDGTGAPEGASYQEAMGLLYTVAYTIKMSGMNGSPLPGFVDFEVPPPECLWSLDYEQGWSQREQWEWTAMLEMPEFVTADMLTWAKEEAAREKPELSYDRLRLAPYDEGLCVEIMHIGPYTEEWESLQKVLTFVKENGLTSRKDLRHHEVYLSDPGTTPPEQLKTVLRHPVTR